MLVYLPLVSRQYKKNTLACQQYITAQYITAKPALITFRRSLRLLEILPKRSYMYFKDLHRILYDGKRTGKMDKN
jgi:hypothetical protein